MTLKSLFLVTRAPFLPLTLSCISVGFASAIYDGYFNPIHALLALIGCLLAHISVNVLNEYYDYKRGTDLLTQRTPFSGGSGALPLKLIEPGRVLKIGVSSLILGLLVGLYFAVIYPSLIIIIIIASAIIFFYTPFLLKTGFAELFPGLGFGPLLVIGTYMTQLPIQYPSLSMVPVFTSIPVGLLVSNLLLLNEFPDYSADLKTGRHHGLITIGISRTSKLYVVILFFVFISVIIPTALHILPYTTLIILITLPLAVKVSINVLKNYNNPVSLLESLKLNVIMVLAIPVLIALGLII